MKRKVYFYLSGITQIIIAFFAIINSQKLIDTMLETITSYPDALQERMTSLFTNSGNLYILIMAIITILMNIYLIFLAYKDRLLKKKGAVIAISIASLFTSLYAISELIAIINIIVIASAKRTRKEDYPEIKKELPILKKEEVNKKKIILSIVLILFYFSQFIWADYIPDKGILKIVIGLLFYIILIIATLYIFNDPLRRDFKIFKDNFKTYIGHILPMMGKFYLIYFVSATLVIILSKSVTSVNQSNVESLPLWYSLPLAIIYAPLVEESLFRGAIRRFIKNDKIFIAVSAIAFGLLHTIFTEVTLYNALVLAIPYATMGGFLAYLYVKTNNMFANISFHAFHNTMAMILSILITGLMIHF